MYGASDISDYGVTEAANMIERGKHVNGNLSNLVFANHPSDKHFRVLAMLLAKIARTWKNENTLLLTRSSAAKTISGPCIS